MRIMQRYSWPGNVRDIENVVERAVVLCRSSTSGVGDLPPKLMEISAIQPTDVSHPAMTLREAMEAPEKRIIESALRANGWNRQLTAKCLGINRTTLYKKMKHYGLDAELIDLPSHVS